MVLHFNETKKPDHFISLITFFTAEAAAAPVTEAPCVIIADKISQKTLAIIDINC